MAMITILDTVVASFCRAALAVAIALFLANYGAGAEKPDLKEAGSFVLFDQSGRRVTEKTFSGKPSLVFFGFTNCPDICPTTLIEISQSLRALGADADKLNVIFISIDPERDTSKVLSDYLKNFDRRIVGLTGDASVVASVAGSVGATFRKVPSSGDNYSMEHSVMHYMMDRNWQRAGVLYARPGDAGRERTLKKLRALIQK